MTRTTRSITRLPALALLGALLASAPPAGAHEGGGGPQVDAERLHSVQSAFLLNIVRFARWEATRFEDADAPVVIGVLGGPHFDGLLEATVAGRTVAGRRIEVRPLRLEHRTVAEADADASAPRRRLTEATQQRLRACHLVFIPEEETRATAACTAVLRHGGTLLVAEDARALDAGATIGLPLVKGRVSLEVDEAALERSKVRLDAKLLRLAKVRRKKGGSP